MTNQIKYVVGFAFNSHGDVILIRKNRPEWQAGKLNGVGGKIEKGETPLAAMAREYFEETGVSTNENTWTEFATLSSPRSKVHCLRAKLSDSDFYKAKTMESEPVEIWDVERAADQGVPNLTWIVPLAVKSAEEQVFVEAHYP